MRELNVQEITAAVKKMCMASNYDLGEDVYNCLKESRKTETTEVGKNILDMIIENADISKNEQVPICQDTGFAVVFIELGQEVHLIGGSLNDAINEGVRQGYIEGYLRKSIVEDPLRRVNTKDNTPAVIYIDMLPGDSFKITFVPKGGGAENMSEVKMMKPADGEDGVKDFIIDRVTRSGANPCPPIVVGVGIGGTFEKSAMLAKKALLREIGERHTDPYYAGMERELLERINRIGIGPQGLGGKTTALDVFIEAHPCHIASLPVAVNINCHAARHKSATL
ncbi:fumarate hydratase [bacterium SM23_31]|nr:MAG: fumarate hydratase [bacterium SM23_31]